MLGGVWWCLVVLDGVGWCWEKYTGFKILVLGGVEWCWLVLAGVGWCWLVLNGVGWCLGFSITQFRFSSHELCLQFYPTNLLAFN